MGCVHARNCAVAHILAAEKVEEASVRGKAFFISDFQGNTVTLNIDAFKDTDIKVLLMPLWVAYMLAWLTDRLYRFIYKICSMCGRSFEIPKTVVDVGAVDMAWRNLCFSNTRSREILGYEADACKLVSEQETSKQARSW